MTKFEKNYEWVGDVDSYKEPEPTNIQLNIMNQLGIMIPNINPIKMILKPSRIYKMVLHL